MDDDTSVNNLKKSTSGTDLGKIEAMLLRDEKLSKAENLTGKFLEVSESTSCVLLCFAKPMCCM